MTGGVGAWRSRRICNGTTGWRRAGAVFGAVAALVAPVPILIAASPSAFASTPVPTISCTSDANVLNTGHDTATGGSLPNDAQDANWTVSGPYGEAIPDSATYLPADNPSPPADPSFAPATVDRVTTAWTPSPYSNANWISQVPTGDGPEFDWYYQYQFNLDDTVDPSTFQLQMNFYADNSVAAIFINGVRQNAAGVPQDTVNPYWYDGFTSTKGAATTLSGNWQAGLNTLIIEVKSDGTPQGFLAQMRPSAVCPVALATDTSVYPPDYRAEQPLTYTATVTNSGPGDAHGVTIVDTLPSALSDFSWTCTPSAGSVCTPSGTGSINDTNVSITVGGSVTYTITGTVPAGTNVDSLDNSFTATPPAGTQDLGCTPACGTAVTQKLATLTVEPATTTSSFAAPGDTITYDYLVTNVTTDIISDIAVDDTMQGPATQAKLSSISCPATSLTPGDHETCHATYTVTQADIDHGSVRDLVAVSGNQASKPVSSSATGITVTATRSPELTASASSPSTFASSGDTINYDILVTNTGNVTLSSVTATGTMQPPAAQPNLSDITCPGSSLPPDGRATCTATYRVTQDDIDHGSVGASFAASAATPSGTQIVTAGSSVIAARSAAARGSSTPTSVPSQSPSAQTSSRTSTPQTSTPAGPVLPSSQSPGATPAPVALPTGTDSADLSVSNHNPSQGSSMVATARGFAPGSTVDFWIHSQPVFLGAVVADAQGVAVLRFQLSPALTELHHIQAVGVGPRGEPRNLAQTVTIIAPPALASTGIPAWPLVSVALLLIAAGAGLLTIRRRARHPLDGTSHR